MLIKFDADESLADRLKLQYGQKVASKAFLAAAADSLDLQAECKCLRRDVQDRDQEIRVLRQTLERARSSAVMLLEACGQGDLLNDLVPNQPAGSGRPAPTSVVSGTETGPSPDESMGQFLSRINRNRS